MALFDICSGVEKSELELELVSSDTLDWSFWEGQNVMTPCIQLRRSRCLKQAQE